jgi:hypothetical protein
VTAVNSAWMAMKAKTKIKTPKNFILELRKLTFIWFILK